MKLCIFRKSFNLADCRGWEPGSKSLRNKPVTMINFSVYGKYFFLGFKTCASIYSREKRDYSNICVLKTSVFKQSRERIFLYFLTLRSRQSLRSGLTLSPFLNNFYSSGLLFSYIHQQTSKGQFLYFFKFSMSKKPTKANNRINTGINTRGGKEREGMD